jgi:hypothetical protein
MKQTRLKEMEPEGKPHRPRHVFELWEHIGAAKAKKVKEGKRAVDSMIAVYKDRITYTFILDNEVASIHFDKSRGEIFFKGHNIKNIKLTENQLQALKDLRGVLQLEKDGRPFLSDYEATLGRYLADKR